MRRILNRWQFHRLALFVWRHHAAHFDLHAVVVRHLRAPADLHGAIDAALAHGIGCRQLRGGVTLDSGNVCSISVHLDGRCATVDRARAIVVHRRVLLLLHEACVSYLALDDVLPGGCVTVACLGIDLRVRITFLFRSRRRNGFVSGHIRCVRIQAVFVTGRLSHLVELYLHLIILAVLSDVLQELPLLLHVRAGL